MGETFSSFSCETCAFVQKFLVSPVNTKDAGKLDSLGLSENGCVVRKNRTNTLWRRKCVVSFCSKSGAREGSRLKWSFPSFLSLSVSQRGRRENRQFFTLFLLACRVRTANKKRQTKAGEEANLSCHARKPTVIYEMSALSLSLALRSILLSFSLIPIFVLSEVQHSPPSLLKEIEFTQSCWKKARILPVHRAPTLHSFPYWKKSLRETSKRLLLARKKNFAVLLLLRPVTACTFVAGCD